MLEHFFKSYTMVQNRHNFKIHLYMVFILVPFYNFQLQALYFLIFQALYVLLYLALYVLLFLVLFIVKFPFLNQQDLKITLHFFLVFIYVSFHPKNLFNKPFVIVRQMMILFYDYGVEGHAFVYDDGVLTYLLAEMVVKYPFLKILIFNIFI